MGGLPQRVEITDILACRRVARIEQPCLEWREGLVTTGWKVWKATILIGYYRRLRSKLVPRLLSEEEYGIHQTTSNCSFRRHIEHLPTGDSHTQSTQVSVGDHICML